MLFLLALPVISCVALFWRFLQIFAPSNVLIQRVRSAPPRWRTAGALLALAVTLLIAMRAVAIAVERGAPGSLNLVVLVLAWDSLKVALLSVHVLLRQAFAGRLRSFQLPSAEAVSTSAAVTPPTARPIAT